MDKNNRKNTEREYTDREWSRLEAFEKLQDKMAGKGYEIEDLSVTMNMANRMSLLICMPICVIYAICFFAMNASKVKYPGIMECLAVTVGMIILTVIHELIHGLFWGAFAEEHFKNIEFGFIKEYLTPYCTCKVTLGKAQYIIGAFMPGLITGLIPMYVSLFTGDFWLFLLAAVMTIGAGGDFYIIIKILLYKNQHQEQVIIDHPTECGMVVFYK